VSYDKSWGKGWSFMYITPHSNSVPGWFVYFGLCSHDTRIKLQFAAFKHELVFIAPRGNRFFRLMGRK
jgi:hypothetical protein